MSWRTAAFSSGSSRRVPSRYTRFDMHSDFDGEFGKYKFNCPEGGPESFEYQIPQRLIARFNELTLSRTWVSFE